MIALVGELFPLLGIVAAVLGAWFIHRIAERVRAERRGDATPDLGPAGTSQLVGQSCSVCGERIATLLDGAFCPDCDEPVHARCEEEHGCFREWSEVDREIEDEGQEAEEEAPKTREGAKEREWVGIRNPGLMWGLWYLFLGIPLLALAAAGFVFSWIHGKGTFVSQAFLGGLTALGLILILRGIDNLRWMRDR
jgi:hypothetical protein